jgi:hypothetical protein
MAISFDERVDYFVRRGKIHCRARLEPAVPPSTAPPGNAASVMPDLQSSAHRSAPVAFHGLRAFKEKFDRQIFRK